jgi:D-glycero-D-manno-heptose 1,7-bisphosphate phosphatase
VRPRALFLDRDGTLVHRRDYPARPDELRLYEGIGQPLRLLQQAGFRVVVVTNQSGVAHGYFGEADVRAMHEHLERELRQLGVALVGIYHCPHHPDGVVPRFAVRCECRKLAPGMLLRAAEELHLDLERSWLVADILDDVESGSRVGCRTVLVDLATEPPPQTLGREPTFVAADTRRALQIVAAVAGYGPDADLAYRPAWWHPDSWHLATPPCRGGFDAVPPIASGGSYVLRG